jgi:hypothetical protein
MIERKLVLKKAEDGCGLRKAQPCRNVWQGQCNKCYKKFWVINGWFSLYNKKRQSFSNDYAEDNV